MKKTFRFVGLMLIVAMGVCLTACGGDDDGGGSGGDINYTSDEIIEMLTGKWEVYGHAKCVSDKAEAPNFDIDYTGTIEFTKEQRAKAKSSVWYEEKIGDFTAKITLGSFIDDYYKYKITRKNGVTYISFGSDHSPNDFKIVSLTKTSFKLVLNKDFQVDEPMISGAYTSHVEITVISQ